MYYFINKETSYRENYAEKKIAINIFNFLVRNSKNTDVFLVHRFNSEKRKIEIRVMRTLDRQSKSTGFYEEEGRGDHNTPPPAFIVSAI